ncbi:homoserine/homoserine lactone efflux protein [Malaciobacter marinus]|jgi:homoserine/homoserine lactone efflux protein|uniref:Homoserine/homoserine lactone efflux protein n=1 Tax=Malaciobacter marinus TaxID=505249 RepID=A0AB36ZS71_9BACT|nr:LysE family transporter [Malaciobacter marinus]PPK58990.1 homoserine/homoserine lactone efflux protein [Malaciobacter marinus]
MNLDIWLTLLIASIFLSISPGAGAVVSMNYGLRYGLKKSYGAILGLQTGLFLQTFIVVIGLGTIISKSVMLFNIIKWLGVLYLLYLAFTKIFEKVEVLEEEKLINTYSFKKAYLSATLINLTNIKSTVFLVAFIPQFLSTQYSMIIQFTIISLTLCIIDTIVMTGYSTLASKLKFLVKDVKAMKIQNRITGFFLALAAFFVSTAKKV